MSLISFCFLHQQLKISESIKHHTRSRHPVYVSSLPGLNILYYFKDFAIFKLFPLTVFTCFLSFTFLIFQYLSTLLNILYLFRVLSDSFWISGCLQPSLREPNLKLLDKDQTVWWSGCQICTTILVPSGLSLMPTGDIGRCFYHLSSGKLLNPPSGVSAMDSHLL